MTKQRYIRYISDVIAPIGSSSSTQVRDLDGSIAASAIIHCEAIWIVGVRALVIEKHTHYTFVAGGPSVKDEGKEIRH